MSSRHKPDTDLHRHGDRGQRGARQEHRRQASNSLSVALAFGLVLASLVGALGHVSGAHLNPAVTLGLAVTRKFPWRYVPVYLGFQLVGATLGALATWATQARTVAKLGATFPAEGVGAFRAIVVEGLITFLLVFVIMAVATDDRVPAAVASTSIGFALVAAVLIDGASTGGAVNPVRALGPMIASLTFTDFWVYLIGPTVGGIAAALLYEYVVKRGDAPAIEDFSSRRSAGASAAASDTGQA